MRDGGTSIAEGMKAWAGTLDARTGGARTRVKEWAAGGARGNVLEESLQAESLEEALGGSRRDHLPLLRLSPCSLKESFLLGASRASQGREVDVIPHRF